MSLFDILRYQNTELNNRTELAALPEDLIALYWTEAHANTPDEVAPNVAKMCRQLATWADSDAPGHPFAYKVFMEALKKYNL